MSTQLDWSDERLLPHFPAPQSLEIYDLRHAPFDVQLSIATAVGLLNREQPQIYLIFRNEDALWRDLRLHTLPCHDSPLRDMAILSSLLTTHAATFAGCIIYDPALKDSINIATMLAAQRNGIVVSPALATQLQQQGSSLPVLVDLRTFRWQSRTQAYLWAYTNLLPDCSPMIVTGMDPDIAVSLRPYLVATKSFIYWLEPRNILPDVRAGGYSEAWLMFKILRAFKPGTAHLGWFLQEGVGTTLCSLTVHPVLASDYMSNLEVWTGLPTPSLSEPVAGQTTPDATASTPALDPQKTYLSFTMSDGDNLQFNQIRLLQLWRDPACGSVPIGWTISPALIEAAPSIASYYRETATEKDDFIAGPSGAGYIYPSFWPSSHLPYFLKRTGRLMQQMQLTSLEVLDNNLFQSLVLTLRALRFGTGMALINKSSQGYFAQMLAPFGVRGILSGAGQEQASWREIEQFPIYQNLGIVKTVDETLALIKGYPTRQEGIWPRHQPQQDGIWLRRGELRRGEPRQPQGLSLLLRGEGKTGPRFLNIYVLAWDMTPSDLKRVTEMLGDEYAVVTPTQLLATLAASPT